MFVLFRVANLFEIFEGVIKMLFGTKERHKSLVFLSLLFASVVSTGMVVVRIHYSAQGRYVFLVWNLFLAWLPFVFSWLAYRFHRKKLWLTLFGCLWLLFLPNSPYLVTDLIHIRPLGNVPLWYDAIMIFSFALTGLFLGFLSLYLMQALVVRRFGESLSWLFVLSALALSSFGVYIGRFLRWNSWDLFIQPITLLRDITHSLLNPGLLPKMVVVSLLLTAVFTFTYVILFSLPQLSLLAEPGSGERRSTR